MKIKKVIVINGRGGCGKDTLCDFTAERYKVRNISSITPIKELAMQAGWDGNKDPKSRKMLADLKQLFVEYNDLCNNYVVGQAEEFSKSDEDIMFVHIRECDEIKKFMASCAKVPGVDCVSLLVRRTTNDGYGKELLGNSADDDVEKMTYDFVYENNKILEELPEDFNTFLKANVLK
ncbi:MAG: hypothetical protein E7384_00940 [Ruminococcaceae bacterium]|nr:hypothetical protein [Oscillospiraceae bacterium]